MTTIFHDQINRLNTNSVKWDGLKNVFGSEDLLPMWVADMDFASPLVIKNSLIKRAEHGVFGYGIPPENVPLTVKNWVLKRYHWSITEEWLLPSSGVVTAIAFSIQALTEEGDQVLVQSPVYPPFFQMIENNNRKIVNNPLVLRDGAYEIDFADFEEKLQSGVKLFILCNPHNPVGRVWRREELLKIGELCKKYNVHIVSDEIHADIIHKPNIHVPIASLSKAFEEITITCIAPSKTFNIPGLQASIMIIPNEEIRTKVQNVQGKIGFHGINIFGSLALEAAYSGGEQWLDELLPYLKENISYAQKFIENELPLVQLIPTEGTYLLWINCRAIGLSHEELMDKLINKGKLALESGIKYGFGGDGFVRMNIGCPRPTLEEGLRRFKHALS
ncbi:pyridoxal phosphate-dependent aminotransferase [Caldibacillus lycopersici]|uniref:cysteine-S-conjugate beta-lyase n=1 Tax=Perspicuibacillus lycopersici TaxID=1325689 RepID=A0AAE3IQW3_9BACI|nr:MalY/PatB family protein [Perspicuibacillus lycopersici]MCU9612766.1 pyridoxal phosphate-dependent aminotransferase [Perspicuibacillus lycopersici]